MSGFLKLMPESALLGVRTDPLDDDALRVASAIVERVRHGGRASLEEVSERFGDWVCGTPLILSRTELERARAGIEPRLRTVLENTAARIAAFADLQRNSLTGFSTTSAGIRMGQTLVPVQRAACYAPGGRYPYPSSILMTAVTARAAGVEEVWVASPRPDSLSLAAAAVAGADFFLATGGAQAIAALAFGVEGVTPCDLIVGPGNRYVTAAKYLVSRWVGIDMLAGPSELLVVADGTCSPSRVAADLLAQAEHDVDARCVLVALAPELVAAVEAELTRQLESLPTALTAAEALRRNGVAVVVRSLGEAAALANRIAPEHLSLQIAEAAREAVRFTCYGSLFVGHRTSEALADYGAGPNHVLPTGGSARFAAGLSVLTFRKARTWLEVREPPGTVSDDAEILARCERLEAHARSLRMQ